MSKRYNNYYVYSPRSASTQPAAIPKKRTSFILRRPLLFTLVFICASLYLINAQHTAAQNAQKAERIAEIAQKQQRQAVLTKTVNLVIEENSEVKFSVAISDMSGSSIRQFGSRYPADAASTAKLITAALFLREVEEGRTSLGKRMGDSNAKYQLRQLIKKSDDEAWKLFNEYLGHPALASYAAQAGATSYDPGKGYISASDMANFLMRLHKGQLLNPYHTKLLLSYMQNTNYEDYISPAIPESANIYHKVGLTDDYVNDAAIITKGSKSLVLVIFTNGEGTFDWESRAAMMQEIAKAASAAYL